MLNINTVKYSRRVCKESQKDFSRFLQISLGSAFELETQMLLCADLNFLNENETSDAIEKIQVLQRRITGLIKYVKTKV